MKISIITPTYNGEKKILNLLQSLEKQSFKDFEVIVVIDGSTDSTAKLLKEQTFGFSKLTVIEQTNQGRAKVRNNGAAAAKGDLLIFFDDDMVLDKNCVELHCTHHQKFNNSILTGALIDISNSSRTSIQLYKSYLSNKWSLPLIGFYEKQLGLPEEKKFISAANFSISKKIFCELEGFDERLTDAEDFDLAIRAYKRNILLYYNHSAIAWHNDLITCDSYIKRQIQYRKSHQKLQTLKPELYNELKSRNLYYQKGIKIVLLKLFTFQFWIWSIDHFNWLKILPKTIRYRIYDLIITANVAFYFK